MAFTLKSYPLLHLLLRYCLNHPGSGSAEGENLGKAMQGIFDNKRKGMGIMKKILFIVMILSFILVPYTNAETPKQCLGEGDWQFMKQMTGNFSGNVSTKDKPESVKLWYLKEYGPFKEYGRHVAAITLSTAEDDCLAVRYGYYAGRQAPNITEMIRTHSVVPHVESVLTIRKLTHDRDLIQVNSIRHVESFQSASLFYFDETTKTISEVWSGEAGRGNTGLFNESPQKLQFTDLNHDGYNDFVLSPDLSNTGVVLGDGDEYITYWIWNPFLKKYTRSYKDKESILNTWELITAENGDKSACCYQNLQKSFCVWVSASALEILNWKMLNEQTGALKYIGIDYGTRETYLVVYISEIDIQQKTLLNHRECARGILNSMYENTQLGMDMDFDCFSNEGERE